MKGQNKRVENRRPLYVSPEIEGKPRFKPGTFLKIMSVYLVGISAVLLLFLFLETRGYYLINNGVMPYMTAAAVAGVLVWLVVGARRLVRRPALKRSMTISLVIISVLVMLYTLTFSSARVNYVNVDMGRFSSPEGSNTLVVLRSSAPDYLRMEEDIRQQNPEMSEEEVEAEWVAQMQSTTHTAEAYDTDIYKAFPVRGKVFYYNPDTSDDGAVIVAQDSEGKVRVHWEDEDTARIYIDNPGPHDRGEFTVSCK